MLCVLHDLRVILFSLLLVLVDLLLGCFVFLFGLLFGVQFPLLFVLVLLLLGFFVLRLLIGVVGCGIVIAAVAAGRGRRINGRRGRWGRGRGV